MNTVIGVEHREGEYKGKKYNNINFHCIVPFEIGKGYGQSVEWISIPTDKGADVVRQFGNLVDCVGLTLHPTYNRFGKVDSIILSDPNTDTK